MSYSGHKAYTHAGGNLFFITGVKRSSPAEQANFHITQGHEAKKPAEAIRHYELALIHSPKNPDCFINLAENHLRLGKYKEAEGYYRKAIEASPESAITWHNLGLFLQDDGVPRRSQKAMGKEIVACFTRAIELSPSFSDPHYCLADFYISQGDLAKAFVYLESFLKLEPSQKSKWHIRAKNDLYRIRKKLSKKFKPAPKPS